MNLDDLIRNTKEGLPVSPQDAARHKKRIKAHKFFDMTKELKADGTLGGKKLSNKERIRGFKAARGGAESVDWKKFVNEVETRKEEASVGKGMKMLPGTSDIGGVLTTISTDVKSILGVINSRTEAEEDASDELKQEDEKDNRKKKEEDKEKDAKKGGMKIPSFIQTAAKPITDIWGNIVKTFGILLAGWGIDKIFKWLGDPKNKKSVEELKEFITVAVPAVLKGILALAALNVGITVAKFTIMLVKGAATMLVGLKNLAGTIINMAKANPRLAIALGLTALAGWGISKAMSNDNEEEEVDESSKDLKLFKSEGGGEDKKVKMNGGGVVPHLKMAGGGVVPEMSINQQIMRQTDYNEDGSISTFQATPEQRKASYAEMGIPSMELWDGSVVPDIGKMGAEKIPAALAQTRQNMVETGASPERIAKLDELIASPDVQPAAIQNSLNRIVPGSKEQVLGDLGDDISAKAKMSGGGLVRPKKFNMGGLVRPKKFNMGGKVPGAGNKDTVPAMLTPGEFVMSKGAVEKYGTSTLASMNAMSGGNNTPEIVGSISGFNQGGMVERIRGVASGIRNTAKKLFNSVPDGGTPNVSILPVPSGGSGGASGGGGGGSSDNDVALFSPINHEDMQTLIVKNMYSILD